MIHVYINFSQKVESNKIYFCVPKNLRNIKYKNEKKRKKKGFGRPWWWIKYVVPFKPNSTEYIHCLFRSMSNCLRPSKGRYRPAFSGCYFFKAPNEHPKTQHVIALTLCAKPILNALISNLSLENIAWGVPNVWKENTGNDSKVAWRWVSSVAVTHLCSLMLTMLSTSPRTGTVTWMKMSLTPSLKTFVKKTTRYASKKKKPRWSEVSCFHFLRCVDVFRLSIEAHDEHKLFSWSRLINDNTSEKSNLLLMHVDCMQMFSFRR